MLNTVNPKGKITLDTSSIPTALHLHLKNIDHMIEANYDEDENYIDEDEKDDKKLPVSSVNHATSSVI